MWFLSSRKNRRGSPARSRRPSHRPHVEALEGRCVPSTAGSLDSTFGNGTGYVTTSLNGDGGAHSTLIQPNGDIILLGATSGMDFHAERYYPDGGLDTSFGSNGIALANFGSGSLRGPSSALYPQAGTANDGKIVQEGYFIPSSGGAPSQILARYNSNGTLDSAFGNGGEVMTTFPGITSLSWAYGVVLTSSGQIVALSGGDSQGRFELARYNTDGSLDTTFGQGGYVITTGAGGNSNGFCTLLEQPDGSLIVTASNNGGTWYLYGFNANGTPNTSFGNHGVATTSAPGVTDAAALYFNAGPATDGQIVVVGGAVGLGSANTLARYNANGSLDTTFGTGGFTQISLPFAAQQLAVDAAGRAVAVGFNNSTGISGVARFNVNGSPDSAFGTAGLEKFTLSGYVQATGLAICPNVGAATDGDILVSAALFLRPLLILDRTAPSSRASSARPQRPISPSPARPLLRRARRARTPSRSTMPTAAPIPATAAPFTSPAATRGPRSQPTSPSPAPPAFSAPPSKRPARSP